MADSRCQRGFNGLVNNESDSEDSSNSEEGSASESEQVQGEFNETIDSDEIEQSVEENETRHLSLEAKVKRLQGSFISIPPLIIKKILQRDDVTGDLHAAKRYLKAMSFSEGSSSVGLLGVTGEASGMNKAKKQKPAVLPKKNKKDYGGKCIIQGNESTGNEKTTAQVSRSEAGGNEVSYEDTEIANQDYSTCDEKAQILQERFKGFPPFVIRKVLGRPDVKEDLQKASECLKDMSPLKGTFKEHPKEDAFKEHNNPDRRKAWEEKENEKKGQGFAKLDSGEKSEYGKGSAELNTGTNTRNKKRNNKRRQRKKNSTAQQEEGNERNQENVEGPRPVDDFPSGSWLRGYHEPQQQCEYSQQPPRAHGKYLQQPFGRGWSNYGGPPRGPGGYYRGYRQRGFPRGGGRGHQRRYGEDYYYNDAHYGPHHWAGYPSGSYGVFCRSYSEADIPTASPQQRDNHSQRQSRSSQRGSENPNTENRRSGGGHNWVGRGAGLASQRRGTKNPPCQREINKLEPNVILIRGLKRSTTFDTIRNFVEARSGEVVHDIAKVNDDLHALVTLEKMSNFEHAKREIESRSLEGEKVTVHRVPVTCSILVRNVASNTTRDALEYYFCNPRIGGEVTSIQYEEGNEEAVVTFRDSGVTQKVLSSPLLKLNKAELKVERFDPSIQETTRDQYSHGKIAVAVDKDIMEFVSATDCLSKLKESLSEQGFTMMYTSGDSVIYVAPKRSKDIPVNQERAIRTVADFTKKFRAIELDVDQNHWDAVIVEISKLHDEFGKDKLSLKECPLSKNKVTIISRDDDSKDLKEKFLEKIAETQSSELRKTYEKQTMDVEEEKLALLKKTNFKEQYLSKYNDLEVDINQNKCTITITGPRKQSSEAKIQIYQYLSKMSERKISLSQTVFEMLNTKEGLERLGAELKFKQLDAVFCIDEDKEMTSASVVGINKKHADEAADLIKSIVTEIKIKVDKDIIEVLRTQKWVDLCDEVRQHFKVYVRRNEYFDTWIAGFKGDVTIAYDRIQKFLDDNSIGTETFFCLDKGVRRHIMEYRKEDIANMESSLKQYSVKVKPGETANAFLLSGTKIGIARVQAALNVLTSSVAVKELKVQQPGLSKYFSTGKGNRLVNSVEHEYKCAIEQMGDISLKAKTPVQRQGNDESVDTISSNESDESDDTTAQVYSSPDITSAPNVKMWGNVRISWKQGNIVADDADVLVGSTIGQLSKVFQSAGVPMIKQHIGRVSVAPKPGSLNCDCVLLTTCCDWDGGSGGAETQLRSIVQQCLNQARQLNATSIAFPIIGTGGLHFPNNTACQIMLSEVCDQASQLGQSSLNDIRFVVFDRDAQLVNAFQQEFTQVSGQSNVPVRREANFFDPRPGKRTKHFGNVSVQVLQGDLVQEQTDAIVNIIGPDMIMANAGAVSKAVAASAGPAVQDECLIQGPQVAGSVVVTGPGNLSGKIKSIIHVVPGKPLQTCIERCLQVADNYRFGSVSLPAIGTGSSGISDADSAQATFQALASVCQNLQNLREVRLVVFQGNMVATFKQTHQQYLTGTFIPSKPHKTSPAKKSDKSISASSTPEHLDGGAKALQFLLFGKSEDCVDRAQTALNKGLTEACKIQAVENDDASKLSERQRKKLKTKACKLDVAIKFEDRIGRIVVRGDPEDVSTMVNNIWEEIQERGKKEKENEQAEVLYKTVKWQYELPGTRKYFTKSVNAVIEKAHARGDTRVTVEVQGEKYVVVFANSTGTGMLTRQVMAVKRTTVGYPESQGEGIALPREWSPMPVDGRGKELTVHLFDLAYDSAEYQKVLNLFQNTGGSGNIQKIQRIQNPHLYQQYIVRKQKMDKDTGINNERLLFHGTAEKNLNDINTTGFNRSFGGTAHGTAYGNGVYFARDASYSMGYAIGGGYSSNRHMYLARVLTGRYTQGRGGMIVPPKGYESVANSSGHNATIFVVFYDAQCYPDYLITFH